MEELRGKAFYNFLRSKWLEDQSAQIESWQIEDKRSFTNEQLFSILEELNIQIDLDAFVLYAEKCDSPEELTLCFTDENHDERHYGQVYLTVFELWRRHCPKKQTLSIFCDELDYLIDEFDSEDESTDRITEQLLELCKILDTHVDEGMPADEVYELITSFIAYDLESFLYDFILHQVNSRNTTSASELLDAFYPYVEDKRWLDLLLVRLLSETDINESKIMIDRLFIELQEDPDIDLGLEMLRTLIVFDEKSAFQMLLEQISSWIHTEEDFQHLLAITCDYFCALDLEEHEKTLREMLAKREEKALDAKFFPTDSELQNLKHLVTTLLNV